MIDLETLTMLGLLRPRTLIVGAGIVAMAGGTIYSVAEEDPELAVIAAAVASGASKEDIRELRRTIKEARENGSSSGSSYDSYRSRDNNWNAGTFNADSDPEAYYGE